jgi:hypothetical protein
MIINSQISVSVTGGNGIYSVEMPGGVRLEMSTGIILMIGKILYNSLISKVENIEERRKIEQYIVSHDKEMRLLGDKLYKEISGEETDISYLYRFIDSHSILDLVNFIEAYGFAPFK